MAREDPQMKIRLPEALKQSIEAAALKDGRTLNAEIVSRLSESFQAREDVPPPAMVEQLVAAFKGLTESRKYQTMVQGLLAGYALNMYELIPDDEPLKANMEPARDLAESLSHTDLEGFEEALGDMLGHDEVMPAVRHIGRMLRARTASEKEMIKGIEARKAMPEPVAPKMSVAAKTSRLTKQRKAALDKTTP